MVITNGYGGTGEFQACNRKSKRSCSGADVLPKLIAELKTRVITENKDCVLRIPFILKVMLHGTIRNGDF